MTAKSDPSHDAGPAGRAAKSAAPSAPSSFGRTDDPSMNEILASIRRVLNEEETVSNPQTSASPASGSAPGTPSSGRPGSDDVFLLDQSMLAPGGTPAPAARAASPAAGIGSGAGTGSVYENMAHPGSVYGSAAAQGGMVAPSALAAAASSVGHLVRQVSQRAPASPRDGTLVEDLVRDAVQPLLKDWLDRNLPGLVERLVQSEIKKMMNQAMTEA